MDLRDGCLFLDQFCYFGHHLQFGNREEVDIPVGPHIQQILCQIIAVSFVPAEPFVLLNRPQLLPLDVELDAGQKFSLFQIGLDTHLHRLYLNHSNQQKYVELLQKLETHWIFALPIRQLCQQVKVTIVHVYFPVTAQQHHHIQLGRVCAVDYVFAVPGYWFAGVVEAMGVEGHQRVAEVDGGFFNCEGVERGVDW